MRRAAVLGIVVAVAVGGWLWLRPADQTWVVEAVVENPGLGFVLPCQDMPEVTGGFSTGGGSTGALYELGSRADGETVAACFARHGIDADVRPRTDADRDRIDGVSG